MFSKVYSTTITGITAYVVTVEVDVGEDCRYLIWAVIFPQK